jgi:transposase
MSEPVFKPCLQHQMMLLPPSLSELIDSDSMVRVVDEVVDSLDIKKLKALYPGGGCSAYDPSMMLKVILSAYASGIYSSRKISKATKENINFMWLTGMTFLDHNTINRFRTERIRDVFEDIFTEVVMLLADSGHITLDTYFLDGTKIEANANKFSFVWKKSSDRYREALRKKVHAHLNAIDDIEDSEEALAPREAPEIDSEAIEEAARRINERLNKKPKDKDLKDAAKAIEKDYLPRMKKYEEQQVIFGSRNSFSKTDTDATFMRMKDDAMGNGQLKAAYNIQAGTENQFIIDTTIHRRPGDSACFVEHLNHVVDKFSHLPQNVVADAGYGSEENYTYLAKQGAWAYVKHNEFFQECKNKKWRTDEMRVANWTYDKARDEYICPQGKALRFIKETTTTSELGFKSCVHIYECEDCSLCACRPKCIKSKNPNYNRRVKVNPRLDFFKEQASELLHSEVGSALRKKRSVDVETVFGDIKRNYGFDRFSLKGLDKVSLEWRLVCMGHNIRKLTYALFKQMKKPVPAS